jgi:hypothetical protein
MGMDYRYLLFFEREARFDVLEHLAQMAADDPDGPTTLVLADRTLTLPFPGWLETGPRLMGDDPSPRWDFTTALCFEPDEEVEAWVDRFRSPSDGDEDELHDAQGRAIVGVIYLTVHHDMSDWPSGTGEDLVLFEFGTPGSSMSVLFWDSTSIRRAFVHLLESCRGVYGLLDLEDTGADLVWLRGEERDDRLPTAEMSLADVERFVAQSSAPERPATVGTVTGGDGRHAVSKKRATTALIEEYLDRRGWAKHQVFDEAAEQEGFVKTGWVSPQSSEGQTLVIDPVLEHNGLVFTVDNIAHAPTDATPADRLSGLLLAMAVINARLIFGAFAFRPTSGELIFRMGIPVDSEDLRYEEFEHCLQAMTSGVDTYGSALREIIDGTKTAQEVIG